MSHVHVQQLEAVRAEVDAAREAVTFALRDPSRPAHSALRQAAAHLESTYTARLFAEFESVLRRHLRAQTPRRRVPRDVFSCINAVARLHRIPDPLRDGVYSVREHRNSIMHPDGTTAPAVTFREAASALNKFLARLP